jgi:lipopolysaccharide export LptBFGC system permease protein LptF
MNRSVLARIAPALFAFYLLAYAGFFAWAWFVPPVDRYLPDFRTEQAARQALLGLLDWAVPLTAAAVVTALSLAAGGTRGGGPALPFSQLVASAVVTFLVLAVGFTALSETIGAGSRWRLEEMAWQTRLAGQYKVLAQRARGIQDWSRAAEYDRLYLLIDPGNDEIEGLSNTDESNAAKARTARPAAAGSVATPSTDVDAGSLVKKAQGYFDREDWFSALWYARLAEQIDPRRADATRLAAQALQKIEDPRPEDESAEDRAYFRAMKAAFDVLNRGDTLAAYYAFSSLARQRPDDADAKEFLEKAKEQLAGLAFFNDEADAAAALPGIERLLWFDSTAAEATEVVWAGRLVTITRERGTERWFFDVEAIRYDDKGAVSWHLSAPRARLSDDEKSLLLKGVDRTDPKRGTRATYHAGTRSEAERDVLALGVGVDDLPIHSLDHAPLAGRGMAELWRIRRELPRSHALHDEISLELAKRASLPFAFIVVSLFALAFGWSLRGRWTGRAPALAYLAAPVIVAAAGVLVRLYLYAHQVLLGFLVLSFDLRIAAIVLGALELALVAAALAVLAGQSTA